VPNLRRALGLTAVLLLRSSAGEAQDPVTIAAGFPDGMYWLLASALDRLDPELAVTAVQTGGSTDNLQRLEAGEVRFALAQQDVVSEHFRNRPGTDVRVVGRVFYDYLHIFVRKSIHLETATDLVRLRAWVGEPGSGTRLTASRFFDSLGMPFSSLAERVQPPAESSMRTPVAPSITLSDLSREFRSDGLDAAMIVTTPGLPRTCQLMRSETVALFSLDPKTLRQLTKEEETTFRGQTAIGRIPAGTYPHQSAPVATISVPVLLLARVNESPQIALRLLRATQGAWETLTGEGRRTAAGEPVCTFPGSAPRAAALSASGLTMLQGVPVGEPLWPRISGAVARVLLLVAAVALAFWAYRRRWHQLIRSLWQQDRLPFVLALLLALATALVTMTTFLLERGINENFSTLGESFWSITLYLFSGLESRTPYTDGGRIVAALGLLLGPAFFAVLSGWLARFFIRRDKRMPHDLSNHFLLLNWNTRAADLVRELHHPSVREREGTFVVVVLTDDESLEIRRFKEAGSGRDAAFEDFYVSIGDPTDERALRNANAAESRSVLVLADDQHGDERTIRSILMLRKIARDAGRTDLHVVVELLNPANGAALDELAGDFPGLLERISGLQVRTLLLSQAALNAGIVDFYSDLLQISERTNEMYTIEVPLAAIGMPFREYAALVLQSGAEDPLLPVGLQRKIDGRPRILTNPRQGEPGWIIERGDRLLVIAYQPPLAPALPVPNEAELVRSVV
jgi:TRAP transporter TAXI family solute receptor